MQLKGHSSNINCVQFSKDGKYLVSGGSDNTVRVWNVEMNIENIKLQKVVTNDNQLSFNNSEFVMKDNKIP